MKITNVATTAIRMPLGKALYTSEGAGTRVDWDRRSRYAPKRPTPMLEYVLVRIECDDGSFGVGEAPVDIGFFGHTLEDVRAAIGDYLGPQIVGYDPTDREYLMDRVDYRGNTCAKCGIDLALHDLLGRKLGASVAVLTGGLHKKRVEVAVEIAGGAPDDMAARCVALMAQGVRAFKPKIGGWPDADAERLRAIRQAVGPDVSLRADANQGYNVKQAIRLCRLAEKYDVNLELIEQPVAEWDLQGMATVRRSVDTMVEADESCFTVHDAMQLIRHESCDTLNIKLGKAGGIYAAKKIAALAEAAGLHCVLGTSFGLGIERAAKLHLASSTMSCVDAVEFTELDQHPSLLAAPHNKLLELPLEDGCLPVPDGPGFGVELDPAEVERYTL